MLQSVKSNSCDYLKKKENFQGFRLCSGFSHKYFLLTALYIYLCSISKNNKFVVHVSMYVYWKLYKNGFCKSKKESEPTWHKKFECEQWRTEGGFGVFKPLPKFWRPSKIMPNSTRLWKLLKIAEFRTPTHQDVRKKGSNIPKLPRFTIVLH